MHLTTNSKSYLSYILTVLTELKEGWRPRQSPMLKKWL